MDVQGEPQAVAPPHEVFTSRIVDLRLIVVSLLVEERRCCRRNRARCPWTRRSARFWIRLFNRPSITWASKLKFLPRASSVALMSAPSVGTKLVLVILLQGRLLGVTRTKAARTLSWINFRRDEPYRHLGFPIGTLGRVGTRQLKEWRRYNSCPCSWKPMKLRAWTLMMHKNYMALHEAWQVPCHPHGKLRVYFLHLAYPLHSRASVGTG